MAFWLFMLAMDLLIPLVMLCFGRRFSAAAPKKINDFFGYRTARSMKTRETWDFSHKVCGRVWTRWGLILLILSLLAMLPAAGKSVDIVGIWGAAITLVQVPVLLLSLIPVERALKEKFGD